MTAPSPNSPLSLNSNSNGRVDRQDDVSSPPNPIQPGITTMLDGSERNLAGQSDPTCPDSYSDALKFRVGGHGSSKVSIVELELCPQFRQSNPARITSVGQSSES